MRKTMVADAAVICFLLLDNLASDGSGDDACARLIFPSLAIFFLDVEGHWVVSVCVVVVDFLAELAMRLEDVHRPSTPSVERSICITV